MPVEIDKTFTAIAKSTWQFLIENGQGCYIPAYQRPYSWDRDNIERLYEDVVHGIRQLDVRPDTINFIGTIIAVHDTRYQTIDPMIRTEVPSRVMTIIDGQQRLSTVLMSNIALHDYIRIRFDAIAKRSEDQFVWLADELRQLKEDLRKTYLIDHAAGEGHYKYYPRIIRAMDDQWSKKQAQAKYNGPIARLTWEYIDHTESGKPEEYVFNPLDDKKKLIQAYAATSDAFKGVKSEIREICSGVSKNYEFPQLISISQSEKFCEAIWGHPLPEEVRKFLAEGAGQRHHRDFCNLLRAVVFARYLNNRVAVTVVTTANQDDAFDMFEALNTTGEPLTAFETFKPQVINSEELSKYENSPSRKPMGIVEQYLERFKKADDKQRATSELLVPFALAATGTKLSKKLNIQRRYLRDEYSKLAPDIDKARVFVRDLAGVAGFMQFGWDVENDHEPHFKPLQISDQEALVGFEVLRELKHSITIAALARFYQHAVESHTEEEMKVRTSEFVSAIKATAAFSAFWRGAKRGTEDIDGHYRDIMRGNVKDGATDIPALARQVDSNLGALSLENYKKALKIILQKGGITGKEEWVNLAAQLPAYKNSHALARFLIFCAADDATPDEVNKKGLIERGRPDVNPMLKMTIWSNEDYFTVEHIAPQAVNSDWDAEIYKHQDTVHQLGNLTLLPGSENSVISDRIWEHKREIYSLLASATQGQFDEISAKLAEKNVVLSATATTILGNASHLSLCKSLAACGEPWTKEIIDQRSRCIAGLAWDRLHPWLFS